MRVLAKRQLVFAKERLAMAFRRRPSRAALYRAGLLLGAVGIIGLFFDSAATRSELKQETIGRNSTPNQKPAAVGALGRIEPQSELIQVGAAIDDRLASLLVSDGDVVKEGEVLGYLDSYKERIADRDRIAAQLKEAERLLEAETRLGEAAVREAELSVRRVKEVTEPRVVGQHAKVQSTNAELANNKDILTSREKLLATGASARRSVDDQRTVVARNQQSLKIESKELESLRAELDVSGLVAQAQLERARAELTRAQAAVGVEALKQQLAGAEARVALAQITAPFSGRILKIMIRPGARVGAMPILKMGDTSEMHAVAEVYETDIGHIKIGQSATVRSRALPGPLKGKVVKIGRMIYKNDVLDVDPAAKVDARVVEVRVQLDEAELAANLTNLSVEVTISTVDAAVASGATAPGR